MIPAAIQKPVAGNLTRKILENSLALFTSQLLSKVFRVLANFLLARFLGPENFGLWALVVSFTELFRFLANFGLDLILVRRMAQDQSASIFAPIICLRILFSGLALIGVWIALLFTGYGQNVKTLIYFYSLSFFLQAGAGSLAAYFQAQLKSASLIRAYTIAGVLYLLLILGGIYTQQTLPFFLASLLATEGALLALFTLVFFKNGGKLLPFTFAQAVSLVKEAYPLALWMGLLALYFRIDTLFVYHYGGEKGAGLYSACFRLSEAFLMIAAPVAASLFPVFSRLKNEKKEELAPIYQKSFFLFFPPTLLIAALVMGASGPIIRFLYGVEFASAAPGLSVIIWSMVFMFANTLSFQAIVACHREKSLAKIAAVNTAINLALNFYLVPKLGFVGACWATVVTEIVNFILQVLVLQKLFAEKLFRKILPHLAPPGLAIIWFYLHPASFETAGIWLFLFAYLVFFLNRKGPPR